MMGTITSSTFTLAFFRSTTTAARATSTTVDTMGGMEKAFWKEAETELLMTWLTPHQHRSPDRAKAAARMLFFFPRLKKAWM